MARNSIGSDFSVSVALNKLRFVLSLSQIGHYAI